MHPAQKPSKSVERFVFGITCLCAVTGTYGAETTAVVDSPDVLITASPIIEANEVNGFSGLTTRTTQAQIRDLGALGLPDALKLMPGVQISLYDAVGNYSGNQGGSIYVRGMGSSRPGSEIKTYLDGIPLYMGVWNHPLMDLLPLHAMSSVSVDKGPQPLLSGNNFSAVNLQTRDPVQAGIHGDGQVSAGSYGTRTAQGSLLGKYEAAQFVVALGGADSDGYRANGDAELRNALAKLNVDINSTWRAGLTLLHVDNTVGDPGDNRYATTSAPVGPFQSNGVGRNESATTLIAASVSHHSADWNGSLKLYRNRGRNDLANDANWGTFDSHFEMSGLRWQEQLAPWKGGEIVLGLDYETIEGTLRGPHVGAAVGTPFAFGNAGTADVPSFRVTSPYLGVSHSLSLSDAWALKSSAGLRAYQSNLYGSQSAPSFGLTLSRELLSFYANHTVGVLYPGPETYSLTRALPMAFAANNRYDALAAQRDRHTEIGVHWDVSSGTRLDVSLFKDSVSDRYVWSGFTAFATSVWSNQSQDYSLRGAEASLRQELGTDWIVFISATALKVSGATVPYAPGAAYTLGVNGRVGAVRIAVDAQRQSSMYSQAWDRSVTVTNERVDGFTVANLRVAYPIGLLGNKGEIFAAASNLFGRDYEYNAGYPMAGRNYRIGVSASF